MNSDIEFGPILNIQSSEIIHSDKWILEEAYSMLSNAMVPLAFMGFCEYQALHNASRHVDFPVETVVIIKHPKHTANWSCINLPFKDFTKCMEKWEETPINKEEDFLWTKKIDDHTFRLTSIMYNSG